MASGERFYQLQFRHREVLRGDIGSLLRIEGIVVGGEGAQAILMLPNQNVSPLSPQYSLSVEEWSEFLQRSDDPEILVMPAKAFHRKLRYEISGAVQQKVWVADGFKCMYCGVPMGKAQLTIDHWVPLERGGVNNVSNYLSCCRRDNKDKGATNPSDWCELKGLDYDFFVNYLASRKIQ